ncbi:MAG: hypothetical protein D9V45_11590 [Chloroflexi bacterium]|nr:MAG: hypothetical protein D9V45_11590 [Chloroflexota bacterium]
MKRKFYIWGVVFTLSLLAVVLVATNMMARGASPAANLPPTDLPPGAQTQIAEQAQTLEAEVQALTQAALIPAASQVLNPTETSWLPNPTYFPPFKATQLSAMIQTQQAGRLLPTIDPQESYPNLHQPLNPEGILDQKRSGKLAGYGIITDAPAPIFQHGPEVGKYEFNDGAWKEERYDSFITIWSGHLRDTPTQGIVLVAIMPHYNPNQRDYVFQSPAAAGDLRITGAEGERLILNAAQGRTFYFDVASLSFIGSLTEHVPTATPVPTAIPSTLFGPIDDAAEIPYRVFDYQSNNNDLHFTISHPTDFDWFGFYTVKPGTITVSLVRLAGSYGLRLVRITDTLKGGEIVGEDLTPGQGRKEVALTDAPAGDYLVRVWSLDGSFNADLPYILRFDAPTPEKVTPILECVTDNGDGSYTARFGYDNPNPFVVVVRADRDNSFQPPPVFRTGQPESFAPGRVVDWFGVLFDGTGLTWVLDGHAVTANRNSPRCP